MDNAETSGSPKSGPRWEFGEAEFSQGDDLCQGTEIRPEVGSRNVFVFTEPALAFLRCALGRQHRQRPCRPGGLPTVPRLQLSDDTSSCPGVPEAGGSLAVYKGRAQAKGIFVFFRHFLFITAVACPYPYTMELWESGL